MGMEHHKISEYIDNLSFRKRVGCVDQEQVFEAIRELSSMYNEILAEVYEENERLKEELETSKKINELRKRELENEEPEETEMPEVVLDLSVEKQVKELRRLKRKDLLEILLEQSKENEDQKLLLAVQKKKILHLEQRLEDRRIDIAQAGTLAEASLKLNGIFDAAQAAADQYLENLKTVDDRCAAMEKETKERCDAMEKEVKDRCEVMERETIDRCESMAEETLQKCQELKEQAQKEADQHWAGLSEKLEKFYEAHAGLRELLTSAGDILR